MVMLRIIVVTNAVYKIIYNFETTGRPRSVILRRLFAYFAQTLLQFQCFSILIFLNQSNFLQNDLVIERSTLYIWRS